MIKEMSYTVYFDGFSSPKYHTRAGYAILIENETGAEDKIICYLNPHTTNNQAEAEGLKNTLQRCLDLNMYQTTLKTEKSILEHPRTVYEHPKIRVLGDSKLIIDGYNGLFVFKNKILKKLIRQCRTLGVFMPYLTVSWVCREDNKAGKLIETEKI